MNSNGGDGETVVRLCEVSIGPAKTVSLSSFKVGKLADLTVLSNDLLVVPEEDLDDVSVVAMIVGGEVRYSVR